MIDTQLREICSSVDECLLSSEHLGELDAIDELRRLVVEIMEPPVVLFTTAE